MRFLTASDQALLIELQDLPATMALYRVVAAQKIAGVRELVPAARTLLVHFEPSAIRRASLIDVLRACAVQAAAVQASEAVPLGRLVDVPVRYVARICLMWPSCWASAWRR